MVTPQSLYHSGKYEFSQGGTVEGGTANSLRTPPFPPPATFWMGLEDNWF